MQAACLSFILVTMGSFSAELWSQAYLPGGSAKHLAEDFSPIRPALAPSSLPGVSGQSQAAGHTPSASLWASGPT